MNPNFKDIEPYSDAEVPAAIRRVLLSPLFPYICYKINPKIKIFQLRRLFRSITTVDEFQRKVMLPMLLYVAKTTMNRFTCEGFDLLDNTKSYLFVSNHRDITLDAALLDLLLLRHNLPACEISFGDNLIANPFVNDLARLNRMFPIHRGGTPREMYNASLHISQYIRYALHEKHRSVWIAQRNGRTKDGDDRTEPGLLKMFTLDGPKDFVENLTEINIVPVAISYEIEPCAKRKVHETQVKLRKGFYRKRRNEDMKSVLEGLLQQKGDVHFCICPPITREEISTIWNAANENGVRNSNAAYKSMAELIDRRIHDGYRLHPSNLEAYNNLNAHCFEYPLNSEEDLLMRLYAKPVENRK